MAGGQPRFPPGRDFAFTVFDDTDFGTVENLRPVYRLLADLGLRTTKSVWSLATEPSVRIGGQSLHDPAYRAFIRGLRDEGYEIGLHGVRNVSSDRATTAAGLRVFEEVIGTSPRVHANHAENRESLYWGIDRLSSSSLRSAYRLRNRNRSAFSGHRPGSPFFWGDLCANTISYVRNFVFDEVNLDRLPGPLPYFDADRPYVRGWFSSCEGGDVRDFTRLLSHGNIDKLAEEGGVCIMYTHFADGFWDGRNLDPDFVGAMRYLSSLRGWFVPVSELLDRLRDQQAQQQISPRDRGRIERRWGWYKFIRGGS
jgi:hypothetical protein